MHHVEKLLILALVAMVPTVVTAEVRTPEAQAAEAEALHQELAAKMQQINQQHRDLLERMQAIEEQRRDLELMMHRVTNLDDYRAGADPKLGGVAGEPAEVGQEQKKELEAQQEEIPELPRISADVGGVLTPKGRLVIEPSLQYVQSTINRVSLDGLGILPAVLIGNVDLRGVDRDTFIGALTARFGITSRLEAELKGSYVSRSDKTRTREILTQSTEESVFSADGSDIGDIEFGLRYQFNRGIGWPFMVGNLRIKSDTGTDPFEIATKKSLASEPDFTGELSTGSGFWSVNPSLTFIYPTDPVVFFGNVGYLWTIEDDKGTFYSTNENGDTVVSGFGKVDPGDAWRFNFGMGIGLNDQSSFSISYQLDLFNETTIENARPQKVVGSDATIGKLIVGYSVRLPGGAPFNLAIGIGATDAAPDTDVTFRMPFNIID
ncbi:MAG: hypothetical protein QNJ73_08240 [Gammaproteobacteria bacterium]|nr:hypothetical protein [Gammaproteobacteria bacterium]